MDEIDSILANQEKKKKPYKQCNYCGAFGLKEGKCMMCEKGELK